MNADTDLCLYEQMASSPFPATESTAKTDTTIVFTGTNFDIASYTPSATFAGVHAHSVVVDSASQATATFNLGVPIVTGNEFPELIFTSESVVHYAPSATALESPLLVSSSLSGLECSFAGDCTYEVTATGLASIVK